MNNFQNLRNLGQVLNRDELINIKGGAKIDQLPACKDSVPCSFQHPGVGTVEGFCGYQDCYCYGETHGPVMHKGSECEEI